eukprot:SM000148S01029  [mRNA]  locus=s148:126066:126431:- [translate_table: standard]
MPPHNASITSCAPLPVPPLPPLLLQPTVYVADSLISTNTAGASQSGSGGTITIVALLAVALVAGAAAILFIVGSPSPYGAEEPYSGPPLSFYIDKFQSEAGVTKPAAPSPPAPAPQLAANS